MATITTINGTDNITDSRAVINTNFSNLNTDKLEASDITGKQDILSEGAFVNGDKTKLDGIETSADVTDTTNVTAAGALMDSELTSIADVKALNQSVVNGASPTFATTNMTEGTDKNFVSDAEAVVIGNTSGANTGDQTISDATITTTDITTNNATTLKHGFLPKLSGTSTEYLDGSGAFSTPAGGGGTPEGTAVLSTGETVGKVLQADGDDTCSWVTLPGGGDALTTNPLSQFAATTSAQFAGVISDETGTGSVVLATSPTLVTPALGAATATSINGATITSGTLNGSVTGTNTGDQDLSGLMVKASNLSDVANAGTARTNLGVAIGSDIQAWDTHLDSLAGLTPGAEGKMITSDGLGTYQISTTAEVKTYLALNNVDNTSDATKNSATATLTDKTLTDPKIVTSINTQTGLTYTLALTDASKSILANNAAAQAYTIPTNASVAFAIGTTLILTQYGAGDVTLSGDTGVTVNGVSAGGVSITSQYGTLALEKIGTDEWLVLGGAGSKAINAQTGTTYTFVLTDDINSTQLVTLSNAAAITATIPTNAVTAFPIGTQIDLQQKGAGKVTVGGAGVTINSKGGNKSLNGQYVGASLVKTAVNTWELFGDLIA